MKNVIKATILSMALMMSGAVYAQDRVKVEYGKTYNTADSKVTMVNNTDQTVYASYGYYDPIEESWVTKGRISIEPYGNSIVNFGGYVGNVYIHAYQPAGNEHWGSGVVLCSSNASDYKVTDAYATNCAVRKEYTQLNIGPGNTTFEFNP